MNEREVIVGRFYKHFKGRIYQVIGIGIHTETGEKMVVYASDADSAASMHIRPYSSFISEVDHNKYPYAKQKYRFELMNGD